MLFFRYGSLTFSLQTYKSIFQSTTRQTFKVNYILIELNFSYKNVISFSISVEFFKSKLFSKGGIRTARNREQHGNEQITIKCLSE